MIWSPLAGGRVVNGTSPTELRVRAALTELGAELGRTAGKPAATPEQVALSWILRHPSRPLPVVGTSSLPRLQALVAAESLQLTREQWHGIWTAAMGCDVP